MNDDLADKLGAKPIEPDAQDHRRLKDKKKLAALIGATEDKYAIGYFFGFGSTQDQKDSTKQIGGLDQAGLGLPDRDYYLNQDDRSKKTPRQYLEHVTKMFMLLGDTPEQAAKEAQSVLAIETALAKGRWPASIAATRRMSTTS